ncbi:TMEM175 family protein [Lacticaseibacillus saniviri]|uniref:Integral membrane protein n=1 Tax=Lacticaseibacillus saniviri JCM 17471 = DSM 24301 TaxID=1293598 RepID=A0A0R2MQX7_9LACO|nr:TMEM175 family protein [Lacticaseibacillus saniviri]KRO16025.1 integral membrane protein [Lacticaseibacillus saniviri JCM 17471 = DSM 24301]MCG4281514.1 TMEM175 family protein [Lacticaseibacillus saniviri]
MNKGRIEAFTDAIVAIAATIMVLELKPPKVNTVAALLDEWPVFLAYLISFSLIYIVWYEHHNLFQRSGVISSSTYFLNGVWLFFLTLIPFVTAWIGESPNSVVAAVTYLLVMLLWTLAFQLMERQVTLDSDPHKRHYRLPRARFNFDLFLLGGLVIAFFVPFFAIVAVGLFSLILIVRMFQHREDSNG